MSARSFTTLPTIDGFDVIDAATGHPVDHRDTLKSATGRAYSLNGAAMNGPRALARALKAYDSDPRDPDGSGWSWQDYATHDRTRAERAAGLASP